MTAQSDEALDALERRLRQIAGSDGPGDDDIERDTGLAADAIQSLRQQVRELQQTEKELRLHIDRRAAGVDPLANHLRERAEAAERRAKELEQALRSVLDTRNAEAKAMMAWQVAADNFTNAKREQNHAERLLLAASNAEKAARELLDAARSGSAHGN